MLSCLFSKYICSVTQEFPFNLPNICIFSQKYCIPRIKFAFVAKAFKYSFTSHLILFLSQKFCEQTHSFLGERSNVIFGLPSHFYSTTMSL